MPRARWLAAIAGPRVCARIFGGERALLAQCREVHGVRLDAHGVPARKRARRPIVFTDALQLRLSLVEEPDADAVDRQRVGRRHRDLPQGFVDLTAVTERAARQAHQRLGRGLALGLELFPLRDVDRHTDGAIRDAAGVAQEAAVRFDPYDRAVRPQNPELAAHLAVLSRGAADLDPFGRSVGPDGAESR